MNRSSLEFAVGKLMDLGEDGDIRLETLRFVRQKTPDIGGENIIIILRVSRKGEEPAGTAAGTGAGAGTAAGTGMGTASAVPDRTDIMEA